MLSAEELRIRASEGLALTPEAEAAIRADDQAQEVKADTDVEDAARLQEQYEARNAEFDQARDDLRAVMRAFISTGEAYAQAYEASAAAARLTGSARPLRLSTLQDYETRTLLSDFLIATRRPI